MKKKNGTEKFSNGKQLIDYWQWAHSDIMSNSERGKVAEYIVATALGLDEEPRIEWDAYDLKTEAGIKIEVKSSAYLQSWRQSRLSEIRFDISPKKTWNEENGKYSGKAKRHADFYVFCLFNCKNKENANMMDLEHWDFFVVKTEELDKKLGEQKTISLNRLKTLNHIEIKYENLKDVIN